jgi:integrase
MNIYRKKLHEDGREYGKYKLKPNSKILFEDYQKALNNETLSDRTKPHWVHPIRDKSYVAIMYLTGARRTEPLLLKKEDLAVANDFLYIKMPTLKKGQRAGILKLKLNQVGVDYIVQQWKKTKPNKPIWNMSDDTGYRIIERTFGKCPHWLRHSFITSLFDILPYNVNESARIIASWTGHKQVTNLNIYVMKTKEAIDKIAEVDWSQKTEKDSGKEFYAEQGLPYFHTSSNSLEKKSGHS